MDHSVDFSRHLSRLVSLIMHQPEAIAEQKNTLRALVAVSQQGPVRLSVHDGVLATNGDISPEVASDTNELLNQLVGHCIRELVADMAAPPADLLNAARTLAAVPIEGDQGRDVEKKLRALAMRGVRVFFDRTTADANPDVVRQFTTIELSDDGPDALFAKLDASDSIPVITRLLDEIVARIDAAGHNHRASVVADMMAGVIQREGEQTDPEIRRAYSAAVRRLVKPTLLRAVASVLPRQRERADGILTVLARMGEEGAEALIEQLTTAPSVSERRAFFNGLVRLNAGVPALIHMLGDPRWYVVRNASELLGELNANEAESELINLLKHDNDRVRRAAAGSLGKVGGAPAGRALNEVLDAEMDLEVQIAILGALGRIATPEAIQRLRKAAESEGGFFKRKPAAYRTAAQQALAAARAGTHSSS